MQKQNVTFLMMTEKGKNKFEIETRRKEREETGKWFFRDYYLE